jgi:hypothetical protein
MPKLFAAIVAVGVAFFATASAAAAQTDPYPSGTTGYDASYPSGNCAAQPVGEAFAIVGVNGGRPFSFNGCLSSEYSWATTHTGSVSLYINTGYSGAYRKNIKADCNFGTSAEQLAYGIGCSEAETSIADAASVGATTVAAWWLDVETGNSWSSSNLALNRDTIQGAVNRLLNVYPTPSVGVYSDASFWSTITGGNGYTPSGLAADWLAAGQCPATANSNIGFTQSPIWLLQQGTSQGVDSDYACPQPPA